MLLRTTELLICYMKHQHQDMPFPTEYRIIEYLSLFIVFITLIVTVQKLGL